MAMNIVMMTNTYLPIVGGVAKSVDTFTQHYKKRGHRVLVVAPKAKGAEEDQDGLIRVPAIQNFNGSDFSVSLPVPLILKHYVEEFKPDIIHSHHPFLLGDSALRVASRLDLPLVYTFHTRYEFYTHYTPLESETMRDFVIELTTHYCDLVDHVIAPSESIRKLLVARGIETPMSVVPTGIDQDKFKEGDGKRFRRKHAIPEDCYLVGHVGRLTKEKNCDMLCRIVRSFIQQYPQAHFLVVGDGPSRASMEQIFDQDDLSTPVHFVGSQTGQDLIDAYHAMDTFAFVSHTETQGMVIAEAMSAGIPVTAIDAPGSRDIIENNVNGRLAENENEMVEALLWHARLIPLERRKLSEAARRHASSYSVEKCADRVLMIYEKILSEESRGKPKNVPSEWQNILHRIAEEWDIWSNRVSALESALEPKNHVPTG